MLKTIIKELKNHAPFTVFGTATGILLMIFLGKIPEKAAHDVFYILHPLHVFLSALVTSAIFKIHRYGAGTKEKFNMLLFLMIGYLGSVGIATLSDSIIPYIGEILLDMPHRKLHLGFIEKWWLVNPLAVLGIATAYFWPKTKFTHAGHVLISTWASLFHIMMAGVAGAGPVFYVIVFFFLFIAVWLPCCVSDIVFPLLFVEEKKEMKWR